MEWIIALLILNAILLLVNLFISYLTSSGLVQVINSQKTLNDSMQVVGNQMADVEERTVEAQADVRKLTQHFVNFAKGTNKSNQDKPWYTTF
jgi:hypothetical protein